MLLFVLAQDDEEELALLRKQKEVMTDTAGLGRGQGGEVRVEVRVEQCVARM